jgi:VIT1/CCC1 family predicted Fe2+/Mn2+ transporter
MKFLYHVFIFALGIGLGIWIGVKYPAQSQQVADSEDQQAAKIAAVAQAKVDLLNHFVGQSSSAEETKAEMQQMLKDEQQNLQNAKAKLTN